MVIVKAALTLSTGDTNLQVQALTVLNELLKRPENAIHVVNYGTPIHALWCTPVLHALNHDWLA